MSDFSLTPRLADAGCKDAGIDLAEAKGWDETSEQSVR